MPDIIKKVNEMAASLLDIGWSKDKIQELYPNVKIKWTDIKTKKIKRIEKIKDVISIECKELKDINLKKEHWDTCFFETKDGNITIIDGVNHIWTDTHKIDKLVSNDDLFYIKLKEPQSIDVHLRKTLNTASDLSDRKIMSAIKRKGSTETRKKTMKRNVFQTHYLRRKEIKRE